MENEENQRQVSLVSHSPWKSPSAIPTFPQPRRRLLGKVEIQKQDSHFPSVVVSLITNSERRFPRTPGSPSFRLIVRLEYAQRNVTAGSAATPGPHRRSPAGRT